jgi:hypothetical protein
LPILCEKPLTKTDLARRAVRRLPAVIPRHRRDAYDTLRSASASRTSPSPWYHRRLACVPYSRQRRRSEARKGGSCPQSRSQPYSRHSAAQAGRL